MSATNGATQTTQPAAPVVIPPVERPPPQVIPEPIEPDYMAEALAALEQGGENGAGGEPGKDAPGTDPSPGSPPQSPPEKKPEEAAPEEPKPEEKPTAGEPVEAVPPAEKKPDEKPKEENDLIATKMRAITERENRLRQEAESLKAQRREHESDLAAIKEARDAALRGDDGPGLRLLGLSFDQLAQREVARLKNGGAPRTQEAAPTKPEANPEVAALKTQLEQLQQTVQQSQLEATRANIKSMVLAAGEKYELINAREAHDKVFQTLDQYVRENQAYPGATWDESVRLAAEHVETLLDQEVAPLLTTKKVQAKFSNVATRPAAPSPQASPGAPPPQKTLTHSQSSAVPPRAVDTDFSSKACFDRAMAALDGKDKE